MSSLKGSRVSQIHSASAATMSGKTTFHITILQSFKINSDFVLKTN